MRYVIAFAALLIAAAAAAEPTTPRGIVMAYECKHIDPKVTGFTCQFNDGRMVLQMHKQPSEMTPEQREVFEYHFAKIALRYFELGGSGFYVGADFWAPERKRVCARSKNRPHYVYSCDDFTTE